MFGNSSRSKSEISNKFFDFSINLFSRFDREFLFIQSEISSNQTRSLSLIECARYAVQDIIKANHDNVVIVFIVQVPRVAGGCFTGLSVNPWISVHIDELRSDHYYHQKDAAELLNETILSVFEKGLVKLQRLIVDCLPKATSMVPGASERMQKRIEILMDIAESNTVFSKHFMANVEQVRLDRCSLMEKFIQFFADHHERP